mgnify:CR=1 FL=1
METSRRLWGTSFWTPPSIVLMAGIILIVLIFGLGLPVISGFVVYCASEAAHRKILLFREKSGRGPTITTYLLSFVVSICSLIGVLMLGGFLVLKMAASHEAAAGLMIRVTETLKMVKFNLPHVLSSVIPVNSYLLLDQIQSWIVENGEAVAGASKKIITSSFHVVIGSFIGGLIFLNSRNLNQPQNNPEILEKMYAHLILFKECFARVFFAQFYISLFNTLFTGLFLAFIMPILGFPVPFLMPLIFLTFIAGFIPILGNILSNTVITVVALSISPAAALTALGFLIIIHKTEYFLNAWIVGSKTKTRAFELLIAMLFFEAVFGFWGIILAPVVYSYVKEELFRSP